MPDNSKPVLRFAPSPTGYLHIGGARTALFNWLYARHAGGKFLLRIEDTDRERSTPEAVAAIIGGLSWLGLDWDDEPVFQFPRAPRHRKIVENLLGTGMAYRCFATPQELEQMRAEQRAAGKPIRYDGRWRDRDPSQAPAGAPFVVRLKASRTGETVIHDLVQGDVRFANEQLDDMVLLRSDGSPTYMLAVVVDDFDMGVTHVIRGDDHLNNAARQLQIIQAMHWPEPAYGHLPLIHGPDGTKLSKRHGALAVEAYRELGYLPEAMRNYLLRLGWSHGNDEIISTGQAIAWFDLANIGRSPARFDFKKLDNLNAHYLRLTPDSTLAEEVGNFLAAAAPPRRLDDTAKARLVAAMPALKERGKTLVELARAADFLYANGKPELDAQADKILTREARQLLAELVPVLEESAWTAPALSSSTGTSSASNCLASRVRILSACANGKPELDAQADKILTREARQLLAELVPVLEESAWTAPALEARARAVAEEKGAKLGQIAQPLRAALTGRTASPPIFDIMAILGREESLARLRCFTG